MLLEEFLRPAGKTQTEFAQTLGWTKARLNELIKGKRASRRGGARPGGGAWYLAAAMDELQATFASPRRRAGEGA